MNIMIAYLLSSRVLSFVLRHLYTTDSTPVTSPINLNPLLPFFPHPKTNNNNQHTNIHPKTKNINRDIDEKRFQTWVYRELRACDVKLSKKGQAGQPFIEHKALTKAFPFTAASVLRMRMQGCQCKQEGTRWVLKEDVRIPTEQELCKEVHSIYTYPVFFVYFLYCSCIPCMHYLVLVGAGGYSWWCGGAGKVLVVGSGCANSCV